MLISERSNKIWSPFSFFAGKKQAGRKGNKYVLASSSLCNNQNNPAAQLLFLHDVASSSSSLNKAIFDQISQPAEDLQSKFLFWVFCFVLVWKSIVCIIVGQRNRFKILLSPWSDWTCDWAIETITIKNKPYLAIWNWGQLLSTTCSTSNCTILYFEIQIFTTHLPPCQRSYSSSNQTIQTICSL